MLSYYEGVYRIDPAPWYLWGRAEWQWTWSVTPRPWGARPARRRRPPPAAALPGPRRPARSPLVAPLPRRPRRTSRRRPPSPLVRDRTYNTRQVTRNMWHLDFNNFIYIKVPSESDICTKLIWDFDFLSGGHWVRQLTGSAGGISFIVDMHFLKATFGFGKFTQM